MNKLFFYYFNRKFKALMIRGASTSCSRTYEYMITIRDAQYSQTEPAGNL